MQTAFCQNGPASQSVAATQAAGQPGDSSGPPGPAIRYIIREGKKCLAVGDSGLILLSGDGGTEWQRITPPAGMSSQNFHGACFERGMAYVFGGRALPGHPAAWGTGAVCRINLADNSVKANPSDRAGWLYGGFVHLETALAYGQSWAMAPGGLLRSGTAGQAWDPVGLAGAGYLLAGDFREPRFGFLVGSTHQIILVRNLDKSEVQPPPVASGMALRACAFAGGDTFWAAGDNGSVFTGGSEGKAWQPVSVGLPAGSRRLADFETIAVDLPDKSERAKRIWIGGGILGVMFFSDDAGQKWTMLPAPPGGPVRTLAYVGGDCLLAGGDGGRIWLSSDYGKSWRHIYGPGATTDVLFIAGPGDLSIWPAVVAHCAAGCNVAVVMACVPSTEPGVPPDQPLRAAASAASAGGLTALNDFRSYAMAQTQPAATKSEIVANWSRVIDSPAEKEIVLQLAAAMRQYRPLVVATGPDTRDKTGLAAENRLVARLAAQAVELAAADEKILASVGLPPWQVKRVMTGMEYNAGRSWPWERSAARADFKNAACVIDAGRFPAGRSAPVELIAQSAIWQMPWFGLLDRPAMATGYTCPAAGTGKLMPLMTIDLTNHRQNIASISDEQRQAASIDPLNIACMRGNAGTALSDYLKLAEQFKDTPSSAAVGDRMLLTWAALLDQSRLILADQALDAFLKLGRSHELYQSLNMHALAATLSCEWSAQLAIQGPVQSDKPAGVKRAVEAFEKWQAWSGSPQGAVLLARGMTLSGRPEQAQAILRQMLMTTTDPDWRRVANVELKILGTADTRPNLATDALAGQINEAGKPDGLLDEPFWANVPARQLLLADGLKPKSEPPATAKIFRSVSALVVGLKLPATEGRSWRVQIAADVDRDCTSQILLEFDGAGGKSAKLLLGQAPPARLDEKTFIAAGKADSEWQTFEIVLPLTKVGVNPLDGGLWLFQITATARDADGSRTTLYFRPQGDERLLPHRYGLLMLDPAAVPKQ
ncbi:MAG: hypothetical protein HZA50_05485 [Planctomycetes bacterium]|nr:hypothetical protein [Planctomycetota bacterium]